MSSNLLARFRPRCPMLSTERLTCGLPFSSSHPALSGGAR